VKNILQCFTQGKAGWKRMQR